MLAQGRVADIERRLRVGAVSAPGCWATRRRSRPPRRGSQQPDVASAQRLEDGTIEIGFHGDDDGAAALLSAAVRADLRVGDLRSRGERPRRAVPAGHRAEDPIAAGAVCVTTVAPPPTRRLGALRDVGTGIAAVGVKELRGRMRGRRAFVMLTIHLVIVAGFAWMIASLAERSAAGGFSGISASAEIGRTLFSALIMLLTLIVLVLAPASTAGAISLEREKQTLDLLTTTPISSLAIILGKLLSALSWVFLLLLASIPVTALVFTFGGVGPRTSSGATWCCSPRRSPSGRWACSCRPWSSGPRRRPSSTWS